MIIVPSNLVKREREGLFTSQLFGKDLIFFERVGKRGVSTSAIVRFRCSFRVGIEVLLAARLEQRPPSWSRRPSERLGEGV